MAICRTATFGGDLASRSTSIRRASKLAQTLANISRRVIRVDLCFRVSAVRRTTASASGVKSARSNSNITSECSAIVSVFPSLVPRKRYGRNPRLSKKGGRHTACDRLGYALASLVLSAVLSPILAGELRGPVANPLAIPALFAVNAAWGTGCGLVALGVQHLRGRRA